MTYAKLIAVLGLLIGGYWMYNHAFTQGKKEGAAVTQEAWDQDKEAIEKLDDAAIAKANKERDDALANNEAVSHDLQAELDSARGLNTDLSNRLRQYQSRAPAHSGSLPEAPGGQVVVSVTSGSSVADLDAALGAALSECRSNYYNQVALIKELLPQL